MVLAIMWHRRSEWCRIGKSFSVLSAYQGAGTIWAEKDKVKGITTAASLWATAAIGLTAGIGDYPLAAVVTFLVVIILASGSILRKIGLEKD